jgi:hypothetical protein
MQLIATRASLIEKQYKNESKMGGRGIAAAHRRGRGGGAVHLERLRAAQGAHTHLTNRMFYIKKQTDITTRTRQKNRMTETMTEPTNKTT